MNKNMNETARKTSGDGIKSIFDFSITKFITPSLMKLYYLVGFVIISLIHIVVAISILFTDLGMPVGIVLLLFILIVIVCAISWLLWIIFLRGIVEFTMAFFNIERNASRMEAYLDKLANGNKEQLQ